MQAPLLHHAQVMPQFERRAGFRFDAVNVAAGLSIFTLGLAKKFTGSYQLGFLGFAGLALVALVALVGLKNHWRAAWPKLAGDGAAPVRV